MLFLKRNLGVILITTIVTTAIATYFAFTKTQPSFHTILFTTIANQSDSDSQSKEQASTYFGETLMGWFRNPAFLNKIFDQNLRQGSISAHKQERQNLIIEIDSTSKEKGKMITEKILQVLETEVQFYNQETKSSFKILNLGVSAYQNPLQRMLIVLSGFWGGLFLILTLILFFEALAGKVSFQAQLERFFDKKKIIQIKDSIKTGTDFEFLSLMAEKSNLPVILAGADFDVSDQSVKLALKASEINPQTILIDGDLKEKKLHLNFGLSDLMQNLKGITNRIKKEEKLNQFVHKAIDSNLDFLPAGTGQNLILEDLQEELKTHKTILIHTNLPQNFSVLILEKFELFLFVKLGQTKLKTLELIRSLELKNIQIIVIN